MESEAAPLNQFISLSITLLLIPTLGVILGVIAIIALLFSSALISGSEVAFFSLTHNDYEKLQQENSNGSKRILQLIEKPRTLLATILISNNFINIAIVILSDYVLRQTLPEATFSNWSKNLINNFQVQAYFAPEKLAIFISFMITIVGVTFLLVLFGEVAPKIYAKLNNVKLAKMMSIPLVLLMRLCSPLSTVLVNWTNIIERKLAKTTQTGSLTSREEIDEAIELTVREGQDSKQEIDILKSIIKFGEVSVKQIMRSRVDVVAIDFRIEYTELLKIVKESGFSRIPVYDNDFDNVTGILYVKDLLGHLQEEKDFEWQELIRTDVLYVPEAKKIDDLLREFQSQRLHMAIVVDEYGGSAGIATLEDILEEIIGEIRDEFDDELEVIYRKIDEYNYVFEGKTLLNDVCRVLELDTNTFDEVKGESDSVAGLLLEILGKLPKKDREVHYNQFCFKIVSVSKRRIEQVLITLSKN